MMDGAIIPPAVNETDEVCDVDFTALYFSKTLQDLQITIILQYI